MNATKLLALAYLGDKEFEFSAERPCFLMYADEGRSRIIMGDPVVDRSSADDLLWNFIERSQNEGFRPVFYEISAAEMPRQVDMGFKLFKLGKEARVSLDTFNPECPAAKKLRQAKSRFMRDGYTFTIWDVATVAQNLEQLRAVSDAWLAGHHAKEKGFSLGGFHDDYMRRFPCAVVLVPSGTLVAFASIRATADKSELSIDLMRHVADTPSGVMDYLFTEIMTWGKAQGCRHFNLGMAPLSSLSTHPLAPLWSKIAARIFHCGGSFYSFQGLRDYKNNFSPSWEPRYIAVPSTWSLPTALLDATALIGGGLRGTLAKEKP
ncbi:MAG: phosphatidylglycerol lysyltransferase domain-containing protein [Verrucomicrobiales bacterium]